MGWCVQPTTMRDELDGTLGDLLTSIPDNNGSVVASGRE